MDEGLVGIIVLVGIAIIVAVISSFFSRSYFKTCVISAIISTILVQVAAYLYIGHLDPFFIIALVVGFAFSFVIALVVVKLMDTIKTQNNPL